MTKLFIGINVGEERQGYDYIDPAQGKDWRNLEYATAECEEIYAPAILDHIHHTELVQTLEEWVSKLRHGGKITVGGTDLYEMARQITVGSFPMNEANNKLYGQDLAWHSRKGCYSAMILRELLTQMGLKIDRVALNDYEFVVEAHRE